MFTCSKPLLLAVLVLSTAGCAGYVPKPLAERAVLQELQAVRLEALRPAAAPERPPTEYDPATASPPTRPSPSPSF